MNTIADWERERAEKWAQLVSRMKPDPTDEVTVECLRSRCTGGLGVQLLWLGADRAAITVTLNGETETFEVHPRDAAAAFEHPYAYGATLPL